MLKKEEELCLRKKEELCLRKDTIKFFFLKVVGMWVSIIIFWIVGLLW